MASAKPSSSVDPTYLIGFEGSATEVLEPLPLAVQGTIPAWLDGAVYRVCVVTQLGSTCPAPASMQNGPGVFDVPLKRSKKTFTFNHWFDGLGVMHKFVMHEGTVAYQSRHLNKPWEEWIANGHQPPRGFAQDPCRSIFRWLFSALMGTASGPKDPSGRRANPNINVTIGTLQGKLVSRTDANMLVELVPETLAPKPMFTYTDINPAFKGYLAASHVQYEQATSTSYNYTLDFPRGKGLYHVFCIPDDDAKGRLLASIPATPVYIHSMAMTSKYIVLMVWPSVLDPMALAMGRSVLGAMSWQPDRGVVYHVVDKRAPQGEGWVATYTSEAFFCFHNVNAFEDGDDLVIDLLAYKDMSILYQVELSTLRDNPTARGDQAPPFLRRIRLPAVSDAIAKGRDHRAAATMHTTCDTLQLELPRINPAVQCKQYQYAYCFAQDKDSLWIDRLAKVDVQSGALSLWQEPHCYPGEPLFVGTPGGQAEDDGVILSVVLDGKAKSSFLLVLDARTMKEVGRASVPHVVPFGLHSNFIDPQGRGVDTN